MKVVASLSFVSALVLAAGLTGRAAAADVGVSISIGEPGFYGQIDLGTLAKPPVIYRRPIVIERPAPGVVVQPMYLRVPPGHAKNWRKYCAQYHACGRPVYFVKDSWYHDVYVPHYRKEHMEHRREERREDYREDRRDDRKDKHDNRDKHRNGKDRRDRD